MQAPPTYTTTTTTTATTSRDFQHCFPCRPGVFGDTERNLLSALVNVVVVVVVCVAVFQPQWFWLEGGGCSTNTLSLYLFFLAGEFVEEADASSPSSLSLSFVYYIDGKELKSCVTPQIVSLMQVVIGLVFLMVCASVVQLMLDVVGPAGKAIRCLRKNAVPSIVAVWVCVMGVGVCYHITTLLEGLQEATKPTIMPLAMDRVQVKFDVGFYMFVLAGGVAVLAVGCSWLRPAHIFQEADSAPLMEDCGLEGLDTPIPPGAAPSYPFMLDREPPPPLEGNPPPPYTP